MTSSQRREINMLAPVVSYLSGSAGWRDQPADLPNRKETRMARRMLLKALVASALAARAAYAAPPANMKGIEELQKDWKTFLPAGATVPSPGEPLKLSKDEWRKRRLPDAFRVLRDEVTERAGTSALNEGE